MPVLPSKDHKQVISLGIYTGATVQYDDWDWEEAFDLIYPTPFNWISVHGITPWDNPDSRFMIERDQNGKFYCDRPDGKFYDHFAKMLDEGARHDIGIEWSFFDQYHVRRWLKSKWRTCKHHWLRNNDARIDWGGPDLPANTRYNWEQHIYPLYSNWKHRMPPSVAANVNWLMFKTDAKDNLTWFKASNKIGEAIINYIDRIFSIVAAAKKERPRLRFRYKGFNESLLLTEGNAWADLVRDVDERTLRLMRLIAKKHELETRPWFREYADVNIMKLPNRALDANKYRQFLNMNGALHVEVHGIDYPNEIMPINNNRVLYSSDGAEDQDGKYYDRMSEIADLKLPQFDYKMVPSKLWNSQVMMVNLKNAIKPMAEIFRGV